MENNFPPGYLEIIFSIYLYFNDNIDSFSNSLTEIPANSFSLLSE